MTDKQIIKSLQNIRLYCKLHFDSGSCVDCKFYIDGHCQIEELMWSLAQKPRFWNIENLEKYIEE